MSDPNLPEGVKQKDIDAAVGETFDPNLCLHEEIKCDNCEETMLELGNRAVEEKNRQIENMKTVNQEYNCARKDLPHCIMWLGLTFDKIEITKEAPDWVWWQARSKY